MRRRVGRIVAKTVQIHFTDYFGVNPRTLHAYGAFNISLVNDLPLFIDPFLLFNSTKPEYQQLHREIIDYLRFLREKSERGPMRAGLVNRWYRFPEVKQNWLGFSKGGNEGHGLGRDFGKALHANLGTIFTSFGREEVTRSSHLEKLCLIDEGVGRDGVSDFTTNLIKGFLLEYTEGFANDHIRPELTDDFAVDRVRFNYETESWTTGAFTLPSVGDDFVLLTPRDMLTRDRVWINRPDLVRDVRDVIESVDNYELRASLNSYFLKVLPETPGKAEMRDAVRKVTKRYPVLIDYFIRFKEERGEHASTVSAKRVQETHQVFVTQAKDLAHLLATTTHFYERGQTYAEAHQRVAYLKDVIENKGGHRFFYGRDGKPIRREKDLHILFRLTWFGTLSDVSPESDGGRGPVDFKVSRGASDKSLVEFKLASNSRLKQNLAKQTAVYQKAADADDAIKVVVYFTAEEEARVRRILRELDIADSQDVVLIDARHDNKPPGSRA